MNMKKTNLKMLDLLPILKIAVQDMELDIGWVEEGTVIKFYFQ